MSGSEEALAVMTCERLDSAKPHLLIGGYGMGFTLRAAQAVLGREISADGGGAGARDRRLGEGADGHTVEGMLGRSAGGGRARRCRGGDRAGAGDYDAILLDVDNGPDGLTRIINDQLYSARGLAAARAALKLGGVLAVWSAAPDRAFARRMGEAGFAVDEVGVRARGNSKGPRHVIYFGRKR